MSNTFHHGLIVRDGEVTRPIKTNSTNTLGIVGTAGMGPINDPQLISSFSQALTVFGPLRNDGFTLLKDLNDIFKQNNTRVLVVNVAPRETLLTISGEALTFTATSGLANAAKTHISSVTTTTAITTNITLDGNGEYAFPSGITSIGAVKSADGVTTYVLDTDYEITGQTITYISGGDISPRQELKVAYVATLVNGTDYSYVGSTGAFTRLNGLIVGPATIAISYSYVNPTVTDDDVIGEQGATTAENTGVYALFKGISNFGLTPKLVGAPSHSDVLPDSGANLVLTAVLDAAEKLGGFAVSNTPLSITDAITYRNLHKDKRLMLVQTKHYVTLDGTKLAQNTAAMVLALFAKSDATRREGVAASPSNMKLNGITELVNPVEFRLVGEGSQTDTLNENRISTIANIDGFRLWGNRSTTDDEAYSFVNVIRVSDYVKDIIASSFLDLVDRNITQNFIQVLLQRINGILSNLKASDTINYGRAYENAVLNTPESKQAGTLYIDYKIGIPGIAEKLVFTANIVNGYVANIEEAN